MRGLLETRFWPTMLRRGLAIAALFQALLHARPGDAALGIASRDGADALDKIWNNDSPPEHELPAPWASTSTGSNPLFEVLAPRPGAHVLPDFRWTMQVLTSVTDPDAKLVIDQSMRWGRVRRARLTMRTQGERLNRILLEGPTADSMLVLDVRLVLRNVTLSAALVHVYSKKPTLSIFHPIDGGIVVLAPDMPLEVNFGLTLCTSGVPDCFADFQGSQYAAAQIFLDGELVRISNVSRAFVALADIPQHLWAEASVYPAGGECVLSKVTSNTCGTRNRRYAVHVCIRACIVCMRT